MTDSLEINQIKVKPRPLSPHLQIYSWQLTSLMSIGHRTSGIILALGTSLVVLWLLALASGPEWFDILSSVVSHWFGQLVLFGYSVVIFYHLLNGIRHICWDVGYGFELNTVYRTGYAVIMTAVILTSITWLVVWFY